MMGIVLSHGAGAGQDHPFMVAWAARLRTLAPVWAFDYPYRAAGRKAPDRLPTLVEAHRAAVQHARSEGATSILLVGKSMGSRVACHLAVDGEPALGVVALGYPLQAPSGARRDEVLLALPVPILFVQGERDALCPLDALREVLPRMRAPAHLHVVPGGDHSLQAGARALAAAGVTQTDLDDAAFAAVRTFVAGLAAPGAPQAAPLAPIR